MDRFLGHTLAGTVKSCRIVVQEARDLSEAVATATGVRHESPQVLLIRNGQCVWHTSHRRITAEALANAIEKK